MEILHLVTILYGAPPHKIWKRTNTLLYFNILFRYLELILHMDLLPCVCCSVQPPSLMNPTKCLEGKWWNKHMDLQAIFTASLFGDNLWQKNIIIFVLYFFYNINVRFFFSGGVYPPGAAFHSTSLLSELQANGLKVNVVEKKSLLKNKLWKCYLIFSRKIYYYIIKKLWYICAKNVIPLGLWSAINFKYN